MGVGVGVAHTVEGGGEGWRRSVAGQTLGAPGAGREGHGAVVVQHRDSNHAMGGALG